MFAPMFTSLSVKIMRFSNIHSWMSTWPADWVASAMAIDVRSAGNAGHGPARALAGHPPPARRPILDLGGELARVALDDQLLIAGHEDVGAVELGVQAEAVEDQTDHAQVV